jgi:hypothetical protein
LERIVSQVTLYLDAEAQRALEAGAKKSGLSKSRFVAELVLKANSAVWPSEIKNLAGKFPDFPLRDEAAQHKGRDAHRVGF